MIFIGYKKTIANLKKDVISNKCSFFVGAGISMLSPCLLPSGQELKNIAVSKLLVHDTLKKYIAKIKRSHNYHNIVPEIIFQRIFEALQDDFFPFFEILKIANPNLAHQSLASFADKYGNAIFTTNFDQLLEAYSINKGKIIYLHGSLNDLSKMMIRINQVGKGLDLAFKKRFISNTKNKSIYVFGYSGNDKDIIDALNTCKCKEIIWFVRNKRNQNVLNNLSRISDKYILKIVECNLNTLFKDISKHFKWPKVQRQIISSLILKKRRTSLINRLSNDIKLVEKYAAIGKILFDLEMYKVSSEAYLDAAKNTNDKGIHNKYWFYIEAAYSMHVMGEFKNVFKYARRVIDAKGSRNYLNTLSTAYNMLGLYYLEQRKPKPKKAIPYFNKALVELTKFKNSPEGKQWLEGINIFFGRIYNNLGLAYETLDDFDAAMYHYKKSLKYKNKVGDLISICQSYINISILLYKFGKSKRYYYFKKKAEFLVDHYSLKHHHAYFLRRIGVISCENGHINRGLLFLNKAMSLYQNIKDTHFDRKLTLESIKKYEKGGREKLDSYS